MNAFDTVMDFIDDEYPVTEGYNMDTAKLIKDPRVYKMRIMSKYAVTAYKVGVFSEAYKYFSKAYKMCDEMKKIVDQAREPEKFTEKLFSYLTPIFSTMRDSETTGAIYTGSGVVTISTTYTDFMSRGTKSAVKRNIQERFNLFKKQISDYVAMSKKKEASWKKKGKKPSEKNITALKNLKKQIGLD